MNIKKYVALTLLTLVTSGFAESIPIYDADCTHEASSITPYKLKELSAKNPEMKHFHDQATRVVYFINRGLANPSQPRIRVDLAVQHFVEEANATRSQGSYDQQQQMDEVVCPVVAMYTTMR